jgi:hypothetical protein
MFKRQIQVDIVKPSKSKATDEPPSTPPVDYAAIARESAKEVVKGIVVVTSSYMAADTVRRIAIHIAATKIR